MKKRYVMGISLAVFLAMSISFSAFNAGSVMAHPNEGTESTENKENEENKLGGLIGDIINGMGDVIGGLLGNGNESSATSAPTESTAPVVSETPAESTEPVVSETPAESTEPVVSETPAESTEPVVSETPAESTAPATPATPAPAASEEPTETPAPAASEEPTETPVESTAPATSTPEATVEPTVSPEPTVEPTVSPEPTVEPVQKKDISTLNIQMMGTTYTYTGYYVTPAVTIRDIDGTQLYQYLDFNIEYFNNLNAGTANMKITAIGEKYEGSVYLSFNISRVSIANYSATLSGQTYYYSGYSVRPDIYLRNSSGRYLTRDTDFIVRYSSNVTPGTGMAIITGIGNYSGTMYRTFDIKLNSVTGFRLSARGTDSLKLSWNYCEGADGYIIQGYNTSTKRYYNLKVIYSSRTCSYTHTGLYSSYDYKYRIRPFSSYNGRYYYGNCSSAIVCSTKPATTKISLSTGKRYAKVKWNSTERVAGYEIYMAKPGQKYTKIATVKNNKTSYTKKKLTSKGYYYFIVRSYVVKRGVKIYSSYSPAKYIRVK